jgi:phosphoglycolate phosphatase-like HAD superfamily hydrolase
MIRLVLFDIDGTLIHTNAAGVVAFGEVFHQDFGFPGATTGVRFAGGTDAALARGIFRSQGHEPSSPATRRGWPGCSGSWVAGSSTAWMHSWMD